MRISSQWSLRLKAESRIAETSYFVTLTYETEYIPITNNGYLTLDKSDVQNYIKLVRKYNKIPRKVIYFAVGEYGSKRKRPHYHILLFNVDLETIVNCWRVARSDVSKGIVHIGNVTGASIAYCLKYMMKDGTKIPAHKYDDRLKEFRLMSKGIGVNYLTPQMINFHRADLTRLYAVIEDGIKVPLPRYFRERIWNEKERKEQSLLIKQRIEKTTEHHEKRDQNYTDKERRGAEIRNKRHFKHSDKRDVD